MPTVAFTEAQRVDIRRYMGYPSYGPGAEGFQSWRYFTAYGLLEYRLTNITDEEQAVVVTYLATLASLELAIPATSDNLDTAVAAVWTHNPNELRDRDALFQSWRRRLCQFLGLPVGPNFGGGGNSIALVV